MTFVFLVQCAKSATCSYTLSSQVFADDSEGSPARTVINALINMEHQKLGSCEVLVTKLLQKLARFASYFTFLTYSLKFSKFT